MLAKHILVAYYTADVLVVVRYLKYHQQRMDRLLFLNVVQSTRHLMYNTCDRDRAGYREEGKNVCV